MAYYKVEEQELIDIANAIRDKSGSGDLAFPGDFIQRINDLEVGTSAPQIETIPLQITENNTYTAPEGQAYDTVTVNVPSPDVYAEYTKDSNNHVTAIKFHGFKEIPAGGEGIRTDPNKFFDKNSYLQTIDFSESPELEIIEPHAFNWCQNLTSIQFPSNEQSNLKTIGHNAFIQCNKLSNTLLPDTITDIEDLAFSACSALALTKLPDNLVNLGKSAFFNCRHLAITSIPYGVEELKEKTFSDCREITSLIIPSSVSTIEDYVFTNCTSLEEVHFVGTPTSIGTNIFGGCEKLTDIYVPWSEGTFADAEAQWKDTGLTQTTESVTIHYNQ